jgi:hypothetical protein
MRSDVNETRRDFLEDLRTALPGKELALERASAIFEMNKTVLGARHHALWSAALIDMEDKRLAIGRDLGVTEAFTKSQLQ